MKLVGPEVLGGTVVDEGVDVGGVDEEVLGGLEEDEGHAHGGEGEDAVDRRCGGRGGGGGGCG